MGIFLLLLVIMFMAVLIYQIVDEREYQEWLRTQEERDRE